MRFNRGSIMAPIGSPTKMTGRDQMSIGGLGGGMDFDTSQFLTKSDLPTFDTSQFLTKGDMPTAFDPSQLEQQIGGLQKQIRDIPSYDDTNIRNMIGNIPQFDDSAIRRMIEDNQRSIGNIPSFDPSSLQSQIEANKNLLDNIPQFDDSALRQMIEQNKNRPGFDASGLQSQIGNIEDRLSNLPQFDPSNLQSGIAGLTDRLDNLNIPEYKAPDLSGFARIDDLPKFNPKDFRDDFLSIAREGINIPKYEAPDLSGFARKEDLPVFDKEAFEKEMLGKMQGSINIPKFDRDALIKDIRSGIDIPKPPSFDREALRDELFEDIRGSIKVPEAPIFDRDALIKDIRSGIDIPKPPSFDRQKLIEDIRGGIDIPQAPDLSAFDTRFADMQKRIDELSQRQAPQPSIPTVEPILTETNDLPMQGNGLVRDPYGNMVDPNNLPDNMKLETGPRGTTVRFADDYALQPGDPGYRTNGRPIRPGGPISIRPDLLPPKRDDFMSIGGPGGGVPDPRLDEGVSYLGGSPTFNEQGSVEAGNALQDFINNQDNTVQPAPTEPAAVAPTAGADPTQTQMPMGAIDPVLLQQQTSEKLTDPLIRSLYFGTQDSPGFYQQLQQAGANLIGSDVPLQQTAGLSPLELLARQKAVAGLGGFEPFLQQNRDLVDQAIAQSRRAEELQDPYYTQAEEIYKDTMGAYDPSMTQQFYNPYEDAVVQKTIQDVMEAGDKQDIASRAREISSGAFGGSRARLGAEERRESLGEGLAQALGNIRSQGFQSAQATGLGEFARQQAAKRTGAQGLMGIGVGRGSAASQLGSQLAGYGSQIGGIGQTQEQMRAGQRGELSGYGGVGRGIAETGLGRIFEQQVGQQYRPMQTLGQIGSMLPGYQASQTQIDSGYGMPTDPSAAGLGAAFSAYGALAPRQGQT